MAVADMFLKIELAKKGSAIKGEAQDAAHPNEIDVLAWSWGMRAENAIGAAGDATKATLDELEILKRVDSASTDLMAVMRSNAELSKIVLSIRKAGLKPLEYVRVTLEKSRITALSVASEGTELVERVRFAFKRINVEYVPQAQDGTGLAVTTFTGEA